MSMSEQQYQGSHTPLLLGEGITVEQIQVEIQALEGDPNLTDYEKDLLVSYREALAIISQS